MSYQIKQTALRMVREKTITVECDRIHAAADLAATARALIGSSPVENLVAFMLDGQNRITSVSVLAKGGMSHMSVAPRDVLRAVLTSHAAGFVLAHNHPSGDPTPSPQDREFTRRVDEASKVVGVMLLDHITITEGGEFSSCL